MRRSRHHHQCLKLPEEVRPNKVIRFFFPTGPVLFRTTVFGGLNNQTHSKPACLFWQQNNGSLELIINQSETYISNACSNKCGSLASQQHFKKTGYGSKVGGCWYECLSLLKSVFMVEAAVKALTFLPAARLVLVLNYFGAFFITRLLLLVEIR